MYIRRPPQANYWGDVYKNVLRFALDLSPPPILVTGFRPMLNRTIFIHL